MCSSDPKRIAVVAKVEAKRTSADVTMLKFMTVEEPKRLVNRPNEKREIMAAAERADKIAPITTGLMPNSVPTRGKITTRTSLVDATARDIHIADLIPGRLITSRALIAPAASRSSCDLAAFTPLNKKKGMTAIAARIEAKINADVDDLGNTPEEPAIIPPSIGRSEEHTV